jgi:hypothetical protein
MEEFKIDPTIAYDVVELPSRGIYYSNKKKSVRVAYLTAADENILSSPNLIASSGVVSELLKRKILDKDLLIEDIVEEDKRAILLFLRNTAFGSEYNYTLIDPKTNEKFSVVLDLSVIKMKDFTLVEDSNGEYPYFLKKSEINITFKFLTKKQEDEIEKIKTSWNGEGVAPIITKRLEMMIKSINGNRDIMTMHNFIESKMPISDSYDFKKYANDHRPQLDLTQTVETPSKEMIQVEIGFGAEFFRPFYGL